MIRLPLVVSLIVLLLSSVAAHGPRVAAVEPQPRYYLSLGDSLEAGLGVSDQFSRYNNRLTALLQGQYTGGFAFGLTLAVVGETTSSFISGGQLQQALTQINNPDNDAAVVTLAIGADDLLQLLQPGQPCNDPSSVQCPGAVEDALDSFATNYTQIMDELTAALAADGGESRVVALTYYNPFSGTGSQYEAAMEVILLGSDLKIDCAPAQQNSSFTALGLNDRIACIAAAHGARVADLQPLFAAKAARLTHINELDVHPNERGHEVIYGELLRQLGFAYLPAAVR